MLRAGEAWNVHPPTFRNANTEVTIGTPGHGGMDACVHGWHMGGVRHVAGVDVHGNCGLGGHMKGGLGGSTTRPLASTGRTSMACKAGLSKPWAQGLHSRGRR